MIKAAVHSVHHHEDWFSSVSETKAEEAQRTEAEKERRKSNIIILSLAFVLFATITVAQWIAADVANSAALKADCVSMGVDALSFLASLGGEIFDSGGRVRFSVSFLSYVALFGFTILFLVEGIKNAQVKDGEDSAAVNGYIVLAFALFGLLFDGITLGAYYVYSETLPESLSSMEHTPGDGDETDLSDDELELQGHRRRSSCRSCSVANPIMLAAFMHVLSDLLRSLTTLAEALYILSIEANNGGAHNDSNESTRIDGVATIAVCVTILVVAIGGVFKWATQLHEHLAARKSTPSSEADAFNSNEAEASLHLPEVNDSYWELRSGGGGGGGGGVGGSAGRGKTAEERNGKMPSLSSPQPRSAGPQSNTPTVVSSHATTTPFSPDPET